VSLRTVAVIQAELDEAYAARSAAMKGSYRLDTGQSSQSVTRDLRAINETIQLLEAELEAAQADAACGGNSGLIKPEFRRYG
jgi:hypothetical protein